jgi:hypothetical protein
VHLDSRENSLLAPYRNLKISNATSLGAAIRRRGSSARRAPVRPSVDSLNVAVAAGIVRHLTRPTNGDRRR